MPWWVSRFGLTWASAMVLVAAGVVQAFEAADLVMQRKHQPQVSKMDVEPAPVRPPPRSEVIYPVKRLVGSLSVDLVGAHENAVVQLKVSGCTDADVNLVRQAHGFPVSVFDVKPDATCEVQVRRRDGVFWTRWTPPVRARGASAVSLPLPEQRAGGVGLHIAQAPQGARIVDVLPLTPAWRAGLEPGQIVHSADGQSLAGLTADQMIERITGAEGTRVELAVLDPRTGRTIHHAVPRVYMDGSR